MTQVAILGGGIGGLSAAQELVERGFSVAVYEAKSLWGGKARSVVKPNTGTDGRRDLPGEHGFRFFPGFYKHIPDTMKRIPYPGNPEGVYNNLIVAKQIGILQENLPDITLPGKFPTTLHDFMQAIHELFHAHFDIPASEARFFVHQLLMILTSCQERRLAEYEKIPWWTFIKAKQMSVEYQKLLARGLTRSLVAMQAEVASTRTVGDILIQLVMNTLTPGVDADRLLNGPTNDVWITPWINYLTQKGVNLHLDAKTIRINTDGKKITSAIVQKGGKEIEVKADYFVAAIPVEVMTRLVTPELRKAAPSLAGISHLRTEWMNGIQFYLDRDVPIVNGHAIYVDSTWALTSISQHQFWANIDMAGFGNGKVRGILSIDISDWNKPGDKVVKRPAHDCTAEEIKTEVWAQLKAHLNDANTTLLKDEWLLDWNLDPDITFPRNDPTNDGNSEPLLVNVVNSWQYRPEAYVEVPNLLLAADYVRTYTDLATMEGANEAARRAVNAILDAVKSPQPRCQLWPLHEPLVFAPLREYDYIRFKLGLPHGNTF